MTASSPAPRSNQRPYGPPPQPDPRHGAGEQLTGPANPEPVNPIPSQGHPPHRASSPSHKTSAGQSAGPPVSRSCRRLSRNISVKAASRASQRIPRRRKLRHSSAWSVSRGIGRAPAREAYSSIFRLRAVSSHPASRQKDKKVLSPPLLRSDGVGYRLPGLPEPGCVQPGGSQPPALFPQPVEPRLRRLAVDGGKGEQLP